MHLTNIHEGNKNYKCKFCENVFGQSGTLRDHIINVHQMCHKSEKSSFSKTKENNLKNHQKSSQVDQLENQNQSTKCQLCSKNFNQPTLLKMHMKAFHGFKCKSTQTSI